MSAADEDTELRDLVAQTLHQQGVLSNIKAQLRASIFLALDEHDHGKLNESGIKAQEESYNPAESVTPTKLNENGEKLSHNPLKETKSSLVNQKLKSFLTTEEGMQTVSIVQDLLQFFDLDYTISVFGPELNMRESSEFLSANEIRESFDLPYSDHEPLLVQLLKKRGNTSAERKDQPSSVKSLHSEKPDPPATGPSYGLTDFDESLDKRDALMGSFSYEESPRSPKRQSAQNNFNGLGDLPPLNPTTPKEDAGFLSAREDKSLNEGTAGHISEAYEDDFGSSANSINFAQSNKNKNGTGGVSGGVVPANIERSEISEDLDEEIEEDEEEISETVDNDDEEDGEGGGGGTEPNGVSKRNDITSDHSVSRLSDTELDYAEDVTR